MEINRADSPTSARDRVGVAYENSESGFDAGRRVAEAALANGGIETPQFALAFCGGDVNHLDFYKGVREVVGPEAPIVGGSAVGLITRAAISYADYPCGVAIFELACAEVEVASADKLDMDEQETGRALAGRFDTGGDLRSLLLFYDSLKAPAAADRPPSMNASPPLLVGIHGRIPQSVPIVGAGLVGHLDLHAAPQLFCGDRVSTQEAVGLALRGDCRVYTRVMHGCTPQDGIYHTITKAEGAAIFEVDGQPVVDLINGMYGNTEWQQQFPLRRLTLGVNLGEKFGEFQEENFVNRLIAGLLPGGAGIAMFEPDLPAGTEVQFMLRDAQQMIESARENTASLFQQVQREGRRPLFGLYIDCAGRTAGFSQSPTEEAQEVVDLFDEHDTPLLGFYSGVEIAPMAGQNRGLDWTGVLLMLTD